MKRAIGRGSGRGLRGVVQFAALTAWTVFVNLPAYGGGETSFTASTSSQTVSSCPVPPFDPSCTLEGMTLYCSTTTMTIGPACIGTGNRDLPNELPCTDCDCSGPCEVPPSGTPFCVEEGTTNFNTNTEATTFLCESSIAPALSPWALAACAGLFMVYATWRFRRSRATGS